MGGGQTGDTVCPAARQLLVLLLRLLRFFSAIHAFGHLVGFSFVPHYLSRTRVIVRRDNGWVPDLTTDPIWQNYERSAAAHRRAVRIRVEMDDAMARRYSTESLQDWINAHREEERCFEQLKSASRAIWAKYANS